MMRRPAAKRSKPRSAQHKAFPAPTKGWIANENLAVSTPLGASVMDNWFPMATTVRIRRGSAKWAVIDGLPDVRSLFTYREGTIEQVFAATDTDIYDATSPAPGDPPSVGLAQRVMSGMTNGNWIAVQFQTSGGTFLRLVNGADVPLVYDGSSFLTTPAITGAMPESLNFVWQHKNRLWFIEKNSLNAWYLPVDSIGGAAVKFPLGGVFVLGGRLIAGATWSLDDGGGLSASCAFFTSEGEVAIYSGSNPADAADWQLKGVYRMGKPLGPEAMMRAGGDLVIATDIGFIPLSQCLSRDVAALAPIAVSYPIEKAWNDAVARRASGGNWVVEVWPTEQMALVCPPVVAGVDNEVFAVNLRTGAWARFTGFDVLCMVQFANVVMYGGSDGRIVQIETTGQDEGEPYTGTLVPLFDGMKTPASPKVPVQARATLLSYWTPGENVSVAFDYVMSIPPVPNPTVTPANSVWGTSIWGSGIWDVSLTKQTFAQWRSVGGQGYALAPVVQVSSGNAQPLDAELVQIDVVLEVGDIVS